MAGAGHTRRTKSFLSKRDAMQWARQTEAELDLPRSVHEKPVRDP
jgi:hypothetical protein